MKRRAAATVFCVLLGGGLTNGQAPPRRATAPAALLAYPGFFQGAPIVVRGLLTTRDQAVLTSPEIDRAIPVIFTGVSPADGQVELRATFWDIGRLQRDDPRLVSAGLLRLVPNLDGDWPHPGDLIALVATEGSSVKPASGPPTIRQIALAPESFAGQRVTVTGQFRGRNLYGDLPQAPSISQWDFVLRSADGAIWVTGERPRGKGFNLDIGARVDTRAWLQVTGTVRQARGLVWLEGATQMTLAKPDTDSFVIDLPHAPEVGPSPEVVFSDPEDGEADVPLKKAIRIQFSRDMNPDSFKGNVRWRYAASDAAQEMPQANMSVKYEKSNRSLEVKIDGDELTRFRNIVIALTDSITATDGAKLKPWSMTFAFAGQ